MPRWVKITLSIAIISIATVVAGNMACGSDSEFDEADFRELCSSWQTIKRAGLLQGFSEREIEAQFAAEISAQQGIAIGEAQARVEGINAVCQQLEQ